MFFSLITINLNWWTGTCAQVESVNGKLVVGKTSRNKTSNHAKSTPELPPEGLGMDIIWDELSLVEEFGQGNFGAVYAVGLHLFADCFRHMGDHHVHKDEGNRENQVDVAAFIVSSELTSRDFGGRV